MFVNRLTGFSAPQTVETVPRFRPAVITYLKIGVNEKRAQQRG
jgi:hypothetical protein